MLLTQNPQRIDLNNFSRHRRHHPASLNNISAFPNPVPGLLSLSKPQRLPSRLPPRPQSPRHFPRHRQQSDIRGRPRAIEQQPQSSPRPRRSRHKSSPAPAPADRPQTPPPSSSPAKQPPPSTPIPVPVARSNPSPASHKILSRSDPLSKLSIQTDNHPKRKDRRRRNKHRLAPEGGALPLAEWDFPAPDDDNDADDNDADADADTDREPSTPVAQTGAHWGRVFLDDGPKTAPLRSASDPVFQFPPRTPAPSPKHRRAPSHPVSLGRTLSAPDTVFSLSEDDDDDSAPLPADVRDKMALLFRSPNPNPGTIPLFPSPAPSPRKAQRFAAQRESADGVAKQLFASSSFQIAPEPVELPKPSFLLA